MRVLGYVPFADEAGAPDGREQNVHGVVRAMKYAQSTGARGVRAIFSSIAPVAQKLAYLFADGAGAPDGREQGVRGGRPRVARAGAEEN